MERSPSSWKTAVSTKWVRASRWGHWRAVLGGPAVDLLRLPAGLGHVAAPAQQVGLHQPGAQLQVLPAEVAGGRRGRAGALVQLAADEPREQLELGHLGRQRGGVDESGHRPIIGPLGA